MGDPFTQYTVSGEDPQEIPIEVMVRKLTCGVSEYPFRVPKGLSFDEVRARASAGNQFCEAEVKAKNVGKRPIEAPLGFLDQELGPTVTVASGDVYAADEFTQKITERLNNDLYDRGILTGFFSGEVVNPGVTATQELVWQIPKSATVGTIDFTSPPTSVTAR